MHGKVGGRIVRRHGRKLTPLRYLFMTGHEVNITATPDLVHAHRADAVPEKDSA